MNIEVQHLAMVLVGVIAWGIISFKIRQLRSYLNRVLDLLELIGKEREDGQSENPPSN